MSEVKIPPIIGTDDIGRETVTFTADHSLADVARWICRNKSEAEEIMRLLTEKINELPEHIFAWQRHDERDNPLNHGEWYTEDVILDGDETKYIRADLHEDRIRELETQAARIEKLEAEIAEIKSSLIYSDIL